MQISYHQLPVANFHRVAKFYAPVSSINKSDHHNITEILFKATLKITKNVFNYVI